MLLFSHVWLFATPWTAACQASLSFTIPRSLLKLMSIESVMPSNHLVLCRPLLLLPFPASESFPMSQLFTSGGQSIGASASRSVLQMNIQGWFPLGGVYMSILTSSFVPHFPSPLSVTTLVFHKYILTFLSFLVFKRKTYLCLRT